jgi:hypothetical protein
MDDQRPNREGGRKGAVDLARVAALVTVAVVVAWLLLTFWILSARASWSSDPWLVNTAAAIALSGPVALFLLAILLWCRKR